MKRTRLLLSIALVALLLGGCGRKSAPDVQEDTNAKGEPKEPETEKAMSASFVEANLGQDCERKGEKGKAIEHYKKALDHERKASNPNNELVSVCHFKLGALYDEKNDYDLAIVHYEKALEIDKEKLGPDHSDLAIIHCKIAKACQRKGDKEKAGDHYSLAKAINPRIAEERDSPISEVAPEIQVLPPDAPSKPPLGVPPAPAPPKTPVSGTSDEDDVGHDENPLRKPSPPVQAIPDYVKKFFNPDSKK